MHKNYLLFGAFFGGLAVTLGAFGAHGLQKITEEENVLHGFQTGVQYQMYHALALIGVALIPLTSGYAAKWLKWTANCFITGIVLFSGSLYLLTFLKIQDSSAVKMVGPVTPVGGVFFIAGWLFLVIAVLQRK